MVLGEERGGDLVAEGVGAGVRFLLPGDEAAEGGFARAVRADDGEFLALVDFEIEAAEDVERAVGFRDAIEFRDHVAGVRRRRELEVHHRVVALGLRDALDFREHLDARLDERRLVGRGAEAVDETLDFGDLALLGFVLLELDFLAQDRLALEVGEVSGIFLGAAVGEGDGAGAERVEQRAVVGNEQDRAGVVDEVLLDPDLRADVEVVRRFVEQQDFGLLEEEFRHRDAHLPATGELRAIAGEILCLETEALEHGFDLRLHARRVGGVEQEFEFADFLEQIAVGRRARVEFGRVRGRGGRFFPASAIVSPKADSVSCHSVRPLTWMPSCGR